MAWASVGDSCSRVVVCMRLALWWDLDVVGCFFRLLDEVKIVDYKIYLMFTFIVGVISFLPYQLVYLSLRLD
jgi:hypothetical protein